MSRRWKGSILINLPPESIEGGATGSHRPERKCRDAALDESSDLARTSAEPRRGTFAEGGVSPSLLLRCPTRMQSASVEIEARDLSSESRERSWLDAQSPVARSFTRVN